MPATPNTTPRKDEAIAWQDDIGPSVPRPTGTGVKFRMEHASVYGGDFSALDMLSATQGGHHHHASVESVAPWVTGGASGHGTAPKHRSVVPLPSHLSRETAHVTADERGNVSLSAADMSAGLAMNRSNANHSSTAFRTTFAASQRKGASSPVSRGRVRPGSGLSGLHCPDGQCCGYKHQEAHRQMSTSSSTSSKLFVTFCESSLQEKAAEAQSELQKERDQRETDAHLHQVEVVKLLRHSKAVEAERDRFAGDLARVSAAHEKHVKESSIIRDEFERRWRESEALRAQEAVELRELRELKRVTGLEAEARKHKDELDAQANADMKLSLQLSQKESAENARRAQNYFEELSIARKSIAALEKELGAVRDILAARDAIVRGMEKELQSANDKLSSIAVLKSNFSSVGKAGGARR